MKDHCVVTCADNGYLHVYGPYTKKEARRMAYQMGTSRVIAKVRKLLPITETEAYPVGAHG